MSPDSTAMYLVTIHLPIYLDGPHRFLFSVWHRSLVLLRDSLASAFGTVTVVAPSMPVEAVPPEQVLQELTGGCGIELIPSFDLRCRARHYWTRERGRWLNDVSRLVARADVVHGGLDQIFRPISYDGFREGVRQRRPTVFVQDFDGVSHELELRKGEALPVRLRSRVVATIYERMCRAGVRDADLSLLLGSRLMSRYGKYARNAKEFHGTYYTSDEIISLGALEERLASLRSPRPLRLVYCGRLVREKGVDHSVRSIELARGLGANVELDIIGDGPERDRLAEAVARVPSVRLLGAAAYGRDLLQRLGSYDAMLFTVRAEDTARMIFDGYAAGLPLLAYEIDYVRDRAREDRCVILLPRDDPKAAGCVLRDLDARREVLQGLSRAALAAARYHAADAWHRRRAEWTFEAVERHRAMQAHFQ